MHHSIFILVDLVELLDHNPIYIMAPDEINYFFPPFPLKNLTGFSYNNHFKTPWADTNPHEPSVLGKKDTSRHPQCNKTN